MDYIAVITGDIVHSRMLDNNQKNSLLKCLKKAFSLIAERFLDIEKMPVLEFFRGDSFQAIIGNPAMALRIAILLRAKLRSEVMTSEDGQKRSQEARIGIGIGEMTYQAKKTVISDGPAFVSSGLALDKLTGKNTKLYIITPDDAFNEQFDLYLTLAETIISGWTATQAEAAYYYLLETDKNQTELTKLMNIDQSSLSRRIQSGHIEEIRLLCERFEKLIPQL